MQPEYPPYSRQTKPTLTSLHAPCAPCSPSTPILRRLKAGPKDLDRTAALDGRKGFIYIYR